jgi:hypothetical protein
MLPILLAGVLCSQLPGPAPAPNIRLPIVSPIPAPQPAPAPDAVQPLRPDEWYVIESDSPLLVLPSPIGRVSVASELGPITMRGRFVGGQGVQRKTFAGKHVHTVEAAQPGLVELLIVPVGAAQTQKVIRRTLDVRGESPSPSPEPPTPPKPKPAPYVGKWFLVVVEETEAAAINRGQYFGDPELKRYLTGKLAERPTIVDRDIVDGRTNKPPADLVPYLDRAKGKSLPQLYVVGEKGERILEGDLPPTPAGLLDALRKVGGQ